MTDTSPEALAALVKRLRIRGPQEHERSNHYVRRMEIERHEAADTIAALRAAPVAMRERAAQVADAAMQEYAALAYDQSTVKVFTKDTTPRSHNAAKCYAAGEIAATIRALPLDAPVDYNPSLRGQRNFPDLFVEPAGFGRPAFTDEEAPPADPSLDAPAPVDPVAQATQVLQRAILNALAAVPEEGWCVGLRGLSGRTGLSREVCRAIVADLRAAGLASYHKGLWSDDEMPAGAGYAITAEGRALAQEARHD
jgi:hypothetical protein